MSPAAIAGKALVIATLVAFLSVGFWMGLRRICQWLDRRQEPMPLEREPIDWLD